MRDPMTSNARHARHLAGALLLGAALLPSGCGGGGSSPAPAPTPPLPSGLVAYFPFTGNFSDASGLGNHASSQGASLAPDRTGATDRACSTGAGFLRVADANSLDLTSFTVCAWIRMDQVNDAFSCFLGKDYTSGFAVGIGSGGSGTCPAPVGVLRPPVVYIGHRGLTFSSVDIPCGTWRHVVISYDNASGIAKLYLGGVLAGTQSGPAGSAGTNTSPLGIGRDGTYNDRFFGVIDEVYLFNRVLSADEVTSIFSR